MSNRTRLLCFAILIMTSVSLVVEGVTLLVLYESHFEEKRLCLKETLESQVRLRDAVARFGAIHNMFDDPNVGTKATASQFAEAHRLFEGFGETGEFTFAKREGDKMVFLLRHSHRQGIQENPQPIPFASKLAEPMRRALNGESGTIVGLDYRGATVLAAYEPIAGLNCGIVAKIDLAEVLKPFITAAALAACASLLVIFVGAVLFVRISNPLIDRLEETEISLQESQRKLAEANCILLDLAYRDGLTGIANRRIFDERLDLEWNRMVRERGSMSLLMIDIDHFKEYNDHFGHLAGDDCLKAVAEALDRCSNRPADLLTRYGGEEFAVILPGTDAKGAAQLAEAMRIEIEDLKIEHPGSRIDDHLTISVGVATARCDRDTRPVVLINAADEALYRAKQQGRNRISNADFSSTGFEPQSPSSTHKLAQIGIRS